MTTTGGPAGIQELAICEESLDLLTRDDTEDILSEENEHEVVSDNTDELPSISPTLRFPSSAYISPLPMAPGVKSRGRPSKKRGGAPVKECSANLCKL